MSYLQLAKIYHPDTVPPRRRPLKRASSRRTSSRCSMRPIAALNDERRAAAPEYIEDLEAVREQVGDLDVEAILAAEEATFSVATMLAKAPQVCRGPRRCSKRPASPEIPRSGEFYAWRGYCRFFGAQDKRALRNAVLEDLLRALELSPKCSVAWLFQGQVFKLLNETALSKQAFQKTLELDPANVEAQRELRLYAQRKQ